ncbi:MAG: hypothetical protein QOJ19_1836 [Acidimicrobiia bacterium]|nr:hypothetical protein [Acidimicrobiia bacterium]
MTVMTPATHLRPSATVSGRILRSGDPQVAPRASKVPPNGSSFAAARTPSHSVGDVPSRGQPTAQRTKTLVKRVTRGEAPMNASPRSRHTPLQRAPGSARSVLSLPVCKVHAGHGPAGTVGRRLLRAGPVSREPNACTLTPNSSSDLLNLQTSRQGDLVGGAWRQGLWHSRSIVLHHQGGSGGTVPWAWQGGRGPQT